MSPTRPTEERGRDHIVSRDDELESIRAFLEGSEVGRCLAITGSAGIGKTVLWEAGIDLASTLSYRVLWARAAGAEVTLSMATVVDLVADIEPEILESLPTPQRHALDIALRRTEPTAAPDPLAIAAALLSTFRALALHSPLLVAIDDAHALDPASSVIVSYVARRLRPSNIRILLTRRSAHISDIEKALLTTDVDRLEVGALSFGATQRLLLSHFGTTLKRREMRLAFETSSGNPLFAIELGRQLAASRGAPHDPLPVPDVVEEAFGARVRELAPGVRRTLLAVSLSTNLGLDELSKVVDPLSVEDAVAEGVVVIDRSAIRPSHPMLAAAVRRHADATERRDLHLALADAAGDVVMRARHLALATVEPDADVASLVAAAAELAARRGAVMDAADLGEHALRLTPASDDQRADRIVALGRLLSRADEMERLVQLLLTHMSQLGPGRPRALAHLLLGDAADVAGDFAHIDLALMEAGSDPEVRALALSRRSRLLAVSELERVADAESLALEALECARDVGVGVSDQALVSLVWARTLRGKDIVSLLEPVAPAGDPGGSSASSLERVRGVQLAFRGQINEAREILARLRARYDERGDVQSSRLVQQLLCDVELRAGNARDAADLVAGLDIELSWMSGVVARLHASLAALTGDPSAVSEWSSIALSATPGQGWDRLATHRAVGVAAMLQSDATTAVEHLQLVWDHANREGVDDPGALPVAADLAEAFILLGDHTSAQRVSGRLLELSREQDHPWGLATARRTAAALQLARGDLDGSVQELERVAHDYGEWGLRFDQARTLLLLGNFQRRLKRRAGARRSLEGAIEVFEASGCAGWARRARADHDRVSGRRATVGGELTPSEMQVAQLAAGGLTNKEIAERLFVTVSTVEVHLSHVYAKYGVTSRTQLARDMQSESTL